MHQTVSYEVIPDSDSKFDGETEERRLGRILFDAKHRLAVDSSDEGGKLTCLWYACLLEL